MTMPSRHPYLHRMARCALCMVVAVSAAASGSALAQATGAESNSTSNAPSANPDSTTATGTTSRSDSPTGRDATRNRSRSRSRTGSSTQGDYVPRSGSSSHVDKNGKVVKDRSTGGSPQGRERPPVQPPNTPATQP